MGITMEALLWEHHRFRKNMKDCERVELIRQKIIETRKDLSPEGQMAEGIRKSLDLLVDYIEFMVTPCEDDE